MTVSQVILRTEARHDHIRPKFANRPDDVGQDLVAVPELQGFIRTFGKTKIQRPGEKLLSMIDVAGREQLVSANHAKAWPEFRANQVLTPVTAGGRKISCVVMRSVRPQRDQIRIFVVRMRSDVKNAAEDIQLLQGLSDFSGIHRLRHGRGYIFGLHLWPNHQRDERDDEALRPERDKTNETGHERDRLAAWITY